MEAFSLLKYWRGGGTTRGGGGNVCVNARSLTTAGGTTTIVSTHQAVDTDDDDDDDDDGPFFDLEFAVPDEDETEETEENEETDEGDNVEDEENEDQNDGVDLKSDDGCSDGEREFNFTLSDSSNDRSDTNLTLSPSDDLFFKGRLVPVEPNSSLDSKPPQFPVSLLKSATKFRVLLLRFKKSKLNSTEKTESVSANGSGSVTTATQKKQETIQEENNNNYKNKFLTVKFKVEEFPIMSLFSRDNSKSQKQQSSEYSVSDEKKFSKEVMQKYLKKVKPLYVKVSRRYAEKLRFSGQLSLGSLKPATPPSTAAQKSVSVKETAAEKGQMEVEVGERRVNGKNLKQVNIPAGLRVVCKHLGKSRSASSAVAAAPPAPVLSKRRDDSLMQQQDGIQSAILHCKRSFNGSRDCSESTVLPRSVSDPSHEKSINLSRKSPVEAKE